MNMKTSLLVVLFLAGASAYGQDAATMAAQQAMQASQQATQQAMQDMQTAQQAAQQAMQAANDAAQNQNSYQYFPGRGSGVLSLSVGSGEVRPGTKVRIDLSSPDRHARVYYTTDGWTPTQASMPYTGPIEIDASTHLEAIAVGAGLPRSMLIRADYTVRGSTPNPVPAAALAANGVLAAGLPIRLATDAAISSATARAGDKVAVLLDEDVKAGDTVVAAKGAPVDAELTLGVPSRNGAAGELAFQVRSLTIGGQTVPLTGSAMLEGGVAKDAVIEPGRLLTATVASATRVKP